MSFLDKLVEEKIQRAREEGAFDNLPGKGKPLDLDEDAFIPDDLRLTYKILKNAGCLPPELELRKEIFSLGQMLASVTSPETRQEIIQKLNYKILKANLEQKK
jgi:hypothetical protein